MSDWNDIYVYKYNGTKYNFLQKLSENPSYFVEVDITDDGEWMIGVDDTSRKLVVFKKGSNGIYEKHQTFSETNDVFHFAGAISDDHQWIFFAGGYGKIMIYSFNGTYFNTHQTISSGYAITHVAISSDNKYFIVGAYQRHSIYINSGSSFTIHQTIASSHTFKKVVLTHDDEYLSISNVDSKTVEIFKLNSTDHYNLIKTMIYSERTEHAQFSENKHWFVVSTFT